MLYQSQDTNDEYMDVVDQLIDEAKASEQIAAELLSEEHLIEFE